MENAGQAKTTLFEHALDAGLGIFDVVCSTTGDNTPTTVEKPERKSVNEPNKLKLKNREVN